MTDLRHIAVGCDGKSGWHDRKLASYLLNRDRGASAIRRMISDDIDRFADLGAHRYASDLAEVLDCFESKFLNAAHDEA